MSLAKMFGITDAQVKKMVSLGVIPCSVSNKEKIYDVYKIELSSGIPKTEAITNTADKLKICERTVYSAIEFFE